MIAQFLRLRPKILFTVILVIIVAGVASYNVLPQLEDPVLGKRVGVISTIFPGADAETVEQLVTNKIEDLLSGVDDVQRIRSNSRTGISNIVIELADEVVDVDPVWDRVRDVVANADNELPQSCRDPELEIFPLKAFASIIAIKSRDQEKVGLSVVRRIAKSLAREITSIKGTQKVSTFGDPGEEFRVELSPETLSSTDLTIGAVANQISSLTTTQPAGFLRTKNSSQADLLLDLSPAEASVRQLNEAIIRVGGRGETVRLREIATVEKTLIAPPANVAIVDDQPAIVIGAMVDDRMGVGTWAEESPKVLADFQDQHSAEIEIETLFSQQQFIENRLHSLIINLVTGTVLVIAVVLVMMGWRSMIVVATALPLSAAMVITAMRWMEIPLHQMSVTGLIVALGLLIDNAIVIVEDIRQRLIKTDIATATASSISHLWMPLLGSTLTTTLAFLPIATLPGPPGEFVGTIATSVILAISASFLLAMTVIPALYAFLNRGFDSLPEKNADEVNEPAIHRMYRSLLKRLLGFPLLAILIGVVLPILGFVVSNRLPLQFFPACDRQQIQIEIELPAASPIESTVAAISQIQPELKSISGIERIHWFAGQSAPTFYYNVVPRRRGTPFYAQGIVDLDADADAATVAEKVQQQIAATVRSARVVVRLLEQGPPFDAPIELQIQGPDLDTLKRLGDEVRLVLSECSHVTQTRSDLGETIPKLVLDVDSIKANQSGVDRTAIARQLYSRFEGISAGELYDGAQPIPVRVVSQNESTSISQLGAVELASQSPAPPQQSPLASMAKFRLSSDVGAVVHIDGKRTNEVMAYLSPDVLPDEVLTDFKARLASSDFFLPAGYSLQYGGENQQRSQAVNQLISNAAVLFALMVLTLVVSFGSFRHALIVMVVGGLAIGLGPLSLWVGGFPFGFMAIIGTMGLVGVAINDSIVVLSAIAEQPDAAAGDLDATCEVVMRCTRHILATTLTTIAGFMPLILAGGKFWPPLAVTIAGGVGGATLMALILAPALHLMTRKSPRV